MAQAFVQLDRLSKSYGPISAVTDLSLELAKGESLTLLGPSGCGKTTTLRMVAGLERNDTGSITIGDRMVSDAKADLFVPPDQRKLGMVFQSYAIWPHMTVFDNVAYPLSVRGMSKAQARDKVMAALRLVEMERYADRPAPALSGGQQQRVAIARALVFEPEVLLLDEPLSNLDARLRAQMGEEFRALQRRLGITTLYVTHDQEEAMALSDRVVVMQKGRILQVDAPEAVYRRPQSREVAAFFGSPNLIEAEVRTCESGAAGLYRLSVQGRNWQGKSLAGRPFEPGAAVLIVVRPEDVSVARAGEPARNGQIAWPGTVIDGSFRGPRRTLAVESDGLRFNVECPATRSVRIGETVTLLADGENAWAVERDTDGRA